MSDCISRSSSGLWVSLDVFVLITVMANTGVKPC